MEVRKPFTQTSPVVHCGSDESVPGENPSNSISVGYASSFGNYHGVQDYYGVEDQHILREKISTIVTRPGGAYNSVPSLNVCEEQYAPGERLPTAQRVYHSYNQDASHQLTSGDNQDGLRAFQHGLNFSNHEPNIDLGARGGLEHFPLPAADQFTQMRNLPNARGGAVFNPASLSLIIGGPEGTNNFSFKNPFNIQSLQGCEEQYAPGENLPTARNDYQAFNQDEALASGDNPYDLSAAFQHGLNFSNHEYNEDLGACGGLEHLPPLAADQLSQMRNLPKARGGAGFNPGSPIIRRPGGANFSFKNPFNIQSLQGCEEQYAAGEHLTTAQGVCHSYNKDDAQKRASEDIQDGSCASFQNGLNVSNHKPNEDLGACGGLEHLPLPSADQSSQMRNLPSARGGAGFNHAAAASTGHRASAAYSSFFTNNSLRKTELCKYYAANKPCKKSRTKCNYAHGPEEIKERTDRLQNQQLAAGDNQDAAGDRVSVSRSIVSANYFKHKTKLCKFYKAESPCVRKKCYYAHGPEELKERTDRPQNQQLVAGDKQDAAGDSVSASRSSVIANYVRHKTELCIFYTADYTCPKKKCTYAHGLGELVRKGHSLHYKTKPCAEFKKSGTCAYEQRCTFIHDEQFYRLHDE